MYRHVISLCLALIRGERTNSPKQLGLKEHLAHYFLLRITCVNKFNDRHILYHLKFITASNRASLDQDLDSILSGGNDGKHRVVSFI